MGLFIGDSRIDMKLLTVTEWFGPGRNHPSPEKVEQRTKTIAFATELSLESAINRLAEYQDAYNRHYSMAVNFTLQSVSEIEWISDGAMELMGVQQIETLPKTFVR